MASIESIRRQLLDPAHSADHSADADVRRAAVAICLRHNALHGSEVLLIKRAERDGDPWSGQMAFPGGHEESIDSSLCVTAMRETREEIGLDLSLHGRLIAPLEPARPSLARRGRILVAPFVFEIHGDPTLAPNYEVADVVWAPLAPMIQAQNATSLTWQHADGEEDFPGYDVGKGYIVWGLTYRMLHELFTRVQPGWQGP